MELWTERELAIIANVVSKPIALDRIAKEKRRLTFARVCVEISSDSVMPSSIGVRSRGRDFTIPVSYEWKPRKCSKCHSFGHRSEKCNIISRMDESVGA